MIEFQGPTNVKIYERRLDALLHSPKGAVGIHMKKLGLKIVADAKLLVGVRTGLLKRSIKMKHTRLPNSQFITIEADTRYAKMHHDGTKPHTITASPGRLLRFNVGGKVIYAQKVNHPGSKGTRFLTIPMERHIK